MRLLVIEDDSQQAAFTCEGLREAGHQVELATTGHEGMALACVGKYDAIVLDRMLPGLDGLSLLRMLRGAGMQSPVLVLSALGEVDDRVEGLRAGGDDYLIKPFAVIELLARLDALGRRSAQAGTEGVEQTRLQVDDLEMDLIRRTVMRGGKRIELKPKEFQLLEYLMRHANQVVTRAMLMEKVWNFHFDPMTNVIDVHVSGLRSKLDAQGSPLIHTVRGAGYRLGPALD